MVVDVVIVARAWEFIRASLIESGTWAEVEKIHHSHHGTFVSSVLVNSSLDVCWGVSWDVPNSLARAWGDYSVAIDRHHWADLVSDAAGLSIAFYSVSEMSTRQGIFSYKVRVHRCC